MDPILATDAVSSAGTLFQVNTGTQVTEVWVTVAEVKDISGPGFTRETEDVTSHDTGGWRAHKSTIAEIGEVSFQLNWHDDPTHEDLMASLVAGTFKDFRIVYPTVKQHYTRFWGIVTGFNQSAPVVGVLAADVTIMGSGAPVRGTLNPPT